MFNRGALQGIIDTKLERSVESVRYFVRRSGSDGRSNLNSLIQAA